eukprot:scaffold7407_cov120-Skeletonema_dohrnii-CCMP3373.AAC.5
MTTWMYVFLFYSSSVLLERGTTDGRGFQVPSAEDDQINKTCGGGVRTFNATIRGCVKSIG